MNQLESEIPKVFKCKPWSFNQAVEKTLKIILVSLLAVMSILIVYQVAARYIFNSPSAMSEELLRFSLIWLGILGAALCFMKSTHLSLPLLLDYVGPSTRQKMELFNQYMYVLLGATMMWGGYVASVKNLSMLTPTLQVPLGLVQSVLIISGVLIVSSQCYKVLQEVKRKPSQAIMLAIYVIVSLTTYFGFSYVKGLDDFDTYLYDNIEIISFFTLFISFLFFLLMGTSIAVGLAFSGIFTLFLQIEFVDLIGTTSEKLFSGLDSFGFLALPFFILAGNIMNQGGIAKRLIVFAMLVGKRVPGSLWQTNIVANMMFGSLSGSAIAASTAIGGIITPMAREKNYDMPFSTAVNASSSIAGMLIPPAGAFIVYSMITGGSASIAALFLGGYIPGIIIGLSVMLVAYRFAKKNNYPVDTTHYSLGDVTLIIGRALPSMLLVFVVIGGIIGGMFTAIEASGIAVIYSLVLAICYRTLTIKGLIKTLYDSALSTSVILFLIACSGLMSWSMTFASIPETVGEMLIAVSDNKYVILLVINITLLLVGVFMDMAPAQLIFTPILYPVVTEMGVDPVHFGIIMIYNLSMGIVTPPVGTVLFVSCGISGEKITNVIRPLLPIFLVQFIGLLLVTYFPIISLGLPRFFGLIN
ncbi:TRAP transporter large permease subunit [Vibrio sp. DW001]|uniref:TRAP transporter large permease n=1 Tax=Vibrio sp. DW001 TaxID=2912315 RepID=UPI0023B0A391|nr:TRAP transporter large permease subunit [Vibrio sp. DW001]WED29774.1 TRAP transporter large permease subunit [Vibrio sp. DW001]